MKLGLEDRMKSVDEWACLLAGVLLALAVAVLA